MTKQPRTTEAMTIHAMPCTVCSETIREHAYVTVIGEAVQHDGCAPLEYTTTVWIDAFGNYHARVSFSHEMSNDDTRLDWNIDRKMSGIRRAARKAVLVALEEREGDSAGMHVIRLRVTSYVDAVRPLYGSGRYKAVEFAEAN